MNTNGNIVKKEEDVSTQNLLSIMKTRMMFSTEDLQRDTILDSLAVLPKDSLKDQLKANISEFKKELRKEFSMGSILVSMKVFDQE